MAGMNYSNTVNGFSSGTTNGAAAGSAAGPWGALIGGAVGGVTGLFSGLYSDYQDKKKRRQLENDINDWRTETEKILNDSYSNQVKLSKNGDVERYRQLRDSYNPNDFILSDDVLNGFNKNNYRVEDYIASNAEARKKDLERVAGSIGGATMGRGVNATLERIKMMEALDDELEKNARSAMESDRNFDYNMFQNYITQKQNQLKAIQDGKLSSMDVLRSDILYDQQVDDAYNTNRINLNNAINQSKINLMV